MGQTRYVVKIACISTIITSKLLVAEVCITVMFKNMLMHLDVNYLRIKNVYFTQLVNAAT